MAKRAKRATVRRGDAAALPVGGFCETCRWWDARRKTVAYELEAGLGMCRVGTPMVGAEPGWPVTVAEDWCREYERRDEWDEKRREAHVL